MKTRLIGAILAVILALAGTVVLTGYVRSADARAANGAAFVPVYLVTEQVPAGTTAAAITDFIEVKQIPAIAVVPGYITKLSAIKDQVTDVVLQPGEQLIAARWVDPNALNIRGDAELPDGMQAVTLSLPVEQIVGGTVEPGDTVGIVIASGDGPTTGVAQQKFHKVLVTAVQNGSTTPPPEGSDTPSEPTELVLVTLARTTPDIEMLVWGQKFGTVWLTIEPVEADETGSRVVTGAVVFP